MIRQIALNICGFSAHSVGRICPRLERPSAINIETARNVTSSQCYLSAVTPIEELHSVPGLVSIIIVIRNCVINYNYNVIVFVIELFVFS